MGHNNRVPLLAAVVLAAAVLTACSRPDGGWRPLWRAEWTRVHVADRWELGVAAAGLELEVTEAPTLFRATLLNQGRDRGEVSLEGGGAAHSWSVEPGAGVNVEATLGRAGRYLVRGDDGVMVCSPRLGAPVSDSRLVALVVIDTLRDDHVRAELTPHLLGALRGGRRWRAATANASWTLPSMASLFTARPVLDLTTPEGDLIGVPEGLETWPEVLAADGLLGLGVVANFSVSVLNGFGRGFSTYVAPDGHGGAAPDATWVVARARRWLEAHEGEDVFLYLHLMDPHEPYRDHADCGASAAPLAPLAHRERKASPEEAALLRRLYQGEVRHVDRVLGPFLSGLPDRAVVALTADHGESLGEHGCWGHGLSLYQTEIAVPLVIRAPAVEAGEEETPAQLLDLAPTLLELAGSVQPAGMLGRSLLAGGSDIPAVAATFGAGPLRWAWRDGKDKVILHTAAQPGLGVAPRAEMQEASPLPAGLFGFDLERDPAEEIPRALEGARLGACGRAFASTAGRLVPGLQLLLWGRPGPTELWLSLGGDLDVVQVWSTDRVEVDRSGGAVGVRCADADPLCAVAGRFDPEAGSGAAPVWNPRAGMDAARGVFFPIDEGVPDITVGEAALWQNPERERLVSGYRETIDRLRALGYLE